MFTVTPCVSAAPSDRGQVAEALLRATRVSHVVIGAFSTRHLAIIDADVASVRCADAEARRRAEDEALTTIHRNLGRPGSGVRSYGGEADVIVDAADAGVAWLSSDRCTIGMWRRPSDPAPFVALVRDKPGPDFPRWQRNVARIGLFYERGRAAQPEPEPEPVAASAVLAEVMRHLSLGFAVVDAARTVVYANAAAHRWLAGHPEIVASGGRLGSARPEIQRGICAAVRAATLDEPRRPGAVVLVGESEPPQVITLLPMPASDGHALVMFCDRSRQGDLTHVLLHAFGLTGAERRLACHLLLGRSLEEAATAARIQVSTARSYLKAIFAKTGVRRQSEFVAVVGALVPPVIGRALS